MTDTRRREDVANLLNEKSGAMLYGIYCLVLEAVAERMDGKSYSCEVTYPIKEWAEIAHVDVRTFTRFLQVCSKLADFMYKLNCKLVTIKIDNLFKLQDDITRKVRTKMRYKSGPEIEQTGLGAGAPRPTPPEHSLRSCSAPLSGGHPPPENPLWGSPTQCETIPHLSPHKPRTRANRFTPPTLEDVAAYCKERGNNINSEKFINYYVSNGWMVGKNKMKDWKATVKSWEERDKDNGKIEVQCELIKGLQSGTTNFNPRRGNATPVTTEEICND